MNKENYSSKQKGSNQKNGGRIKVLVLSLLLIVGISIGITLAYLKTNTNAVVNTFEPSHVSCVVTENFNGTDKTNVNVENTSDIDAYIRVKLVTYRVNDKEERIGGKAEIPDFILGDDWVLDNEFYYYRNPVAPGKMPSANLADSMTLVGQYDDADGGKQVIEVMAEAIQAAGQGSGNMTPAELAWGVDPSTLP